MTALSRLTTSLADRYAIDREIGRGGMATVYLARDLKHERLVALKVLEPELGAVLGTERFLSEIRVTANLQHPNILPLFDSGEAEGLLYYVMPFVEGESLRARLEREKQLPIDEALRIATAVASALDYAHRRNVIHRDLKPDNVLMVEGQPLVADFGIALAVTNAGGGRITQTGLSLGTPQYMSPEQATGDRAIDGRSDIYSLGAVTYEMLAGEPPHTGSSAQAIIAKVLTDRPRSVRLGRDRVALHVDQAIDCALSKLPADRFATAQEFADALNGKATAAVMMGSSAGRAPAAFGKGAAWTAAAGVLVAAAAFMAGSRLHRAVEPNTPRFYNMVLPDSAPFVPGRDYFDVADRALSISRDGNTIVYSSATSTGTSLALVRLDLGKVTRVPGTDGATIPVFSPDGRAIAFQAANELRRLSLEDGVSTTLAPLPWSTDLFWGDDGRLYETSHARCVWSIPAAGGQLTRVLGSACSATSIAPIGDGDWMLVSMDGVISVASRRTHVSRALRLPRVSGDAAESLLVVGQAPFVVGPRLVAFVRDSTIYAARFDPKSLRFTSEPQAVLSGVRTDDDGGSPHMALSRDGTFAWVRGGDGGRGKFVWVSQSGVVGDSVFLDRDNIKSYALSNDGKRVAYNTTSSDGRPRLFVVSIDRKVVDEVKSDLTLDPADWIGNDKLIVKVHRYDGTFREGLIAWSGSVAALDTSEAPFDQVSADGTQRCLGWGQDYVEVWKQSAPRSRIRLQNGSGSWCRFSPDGHYLSWVTDAGLFVATTDSDGARSRVQVAKGGADEPRWSADGKQIYYRDAHRWYVVDAPRDGGAASPPRLLFQGHYLQAWASWALGPDGRFLLLSGQSVPPSKTLSVLTNFPEFIERKLRAAK